MAAETDQVADEIVSELGTQRESLLRTQDRVFFMQITRAFFLLFTFTKANMPYIK